VAQGLWFLVGEASPGEFAHQLLDPAVDIEHRPAGIRPIPLFFETHLAVQCGRSGGVRGEARADPLDMACFMWWDIWPTRCLRQEGASSGAVDAAILEAMATIGALPSLARAESALHGLGHWRSRYRERVQAIVDSLLGQGRTWPADLIRYADAARRGAVH
jgi:hypothetical protein